MKLLTNSIIAALTLMILFSSCIMEKRVYRPGFHTEWHHSTDRAKKQQETAERWENLITEEIAVHHMQDTTCISSSEMATSDFASPALEVSTTVRSAVIPNPIKFIQKMAPSMRKNNEERPLSPPSYSFTYPMPIHGTTAGPLKGKQVDNDFSEFAAGATESFFGFILDGFLFIFIIILVVIFIISL